MQEETKYKLFWIGGGLLLLWFMFFHPHTNKWNGEGEVNVFPDYSESVKNYRLPASIEVTEKYRGWFGSSTYLYRVQRAEWPNGGWLEFRYKCLIQDKAHPLCMAEDGTDYMIEVATPPDAPEYEPPSSDY